ncbi:MAG: hypothetical protein R3C14_09030 [Caldilineaceae bacterium]
MEAFIMGLGLGIAGVIIVAFFKNIIDGWIRDRNAFDQPQKVTHTTEKTPAEMQRAAEKADFNFFLLRLAFVILIWIAMTEYLPELTNTVQGQLVEILRIIVNIMLAILKTIDELLRHR